jgi:hypothetical protein
MRVTARVAERLRIGLLSTGEGNSRILLPAPSFAARNSSRAKSDNGSLCSRFALVRCAGIVQTRCLTSISDRRAPSASSIRTPSSNSSPNFSGKLWSGVERLPLHANLWIKQNALARPGDVALLEPERRVYFKPACAVGPIVDRSDKPKYVICCHKDPACGDRLHHLHHVSLEMASAR